MIPLLVLSIVALIATLATMVAVAVILSRALQTAVSVTDRVHERSQEALKDFADRLMAIDFVEFHASRTERETEDGEFIVPASITISEDIEEGRLETRTTEEIRQAAEEERILTEDFG